MGSGKSAVGRALARRLGRAHVDVDDRVVASAGRTIAEVFDSDGEAGFRALETDALTDALDGVPSVISTGGGIVLAEANRLMLADGRSIVVWLDATIDTLVGRVGDGRGRPLLRGDVRETLTAMVRDREPLYDQVADLRVDTTGLRRRPVVELVRAALEQDVTT